ncbi:serine protease 33-like [Plutella xylostella]|uniref:serine protease 33-like n=1 Tax=Plutella xylostella TaxID=51655 RepID=UPI002032AE0D|nr:serine protease 33-like [Plutella xylostella]
MEVPSVGGSRYFVILKDDFSNYRSVYFVKSKDEIKKCIENFLYKAENITNNKVLCFRSDNGTEFVNREEKRRKWDPKGEKAVMVGYGEDVKGYRIYYSEKNIVEVKRDVVFLDRGGELQKEQLVMLDSTVKEKDGTSQEHLEDRDEKAEDQGKTMEIEGAQPEEKEAGGNRTARFLFDAFFGLEVPLLEEQSVEDDEEQDGTAVKDCSCACGRANPLPRKLECGGPNQENRIVGGLPAGLNRYPWMARIVYDGQFHCGASLLSKEYVLTAAHCVRKLKRSKIRVILGDHDQTITTESSAIMRAVTTIVRHRSFDADSYNNDIALLKLRKPVTFSKIIKPVCLPPTVFDPSGKEGIVVGWGRTSEGGQLPAVVQEVRVPILSLQQCRGMKYRASRITSNMLCAGRASTDSCQGDSGGPLLLQTGDKYQIVGIVSWGVGCGRPGYPGVYTRVTKYLPWLRANLRDTCLCAN